MADATKWDGGYGAADLAQHERMRAALCSLPGYVFEFLGDHHGLLERLQRDPPELVLNFCDTGVGNVATRELHLPALLEVLGIPYSGAPPACIALCYDKAVVRPIARAHGVPVPDELYVAPEQPLDAVSSARYPALVKPAIGDGSVGIGRDAVVDSDEQARACVARLRSDRTTRPTLSSGPSVRRSRFRDQRRSCSARVERSHRVSHFEALVAAAVDGHDARRLVCA